MSLVIDFKTEYGRGPPNLPPSCGSLPLPPNELRGSGHETGVGFGGIGIEIDSG